MAKDVFTKLDVNVKVIELNQMPQGRDVLQELYTITQLNTVSLSSSKLVIKSSGYSVKMGAQELYVVWGPLSLDQGPCYEIGAPVLNYSMM